MRITHASLQPPETLTRRGFEVVVRRLADDLAYGTDSSLYVGSGLEYAQSRPYVAGDPVKQMDWRVTARTGKLHVKEYDALKRVSVYIIVDTSASMGFASDELSKHDLAVWLAAALALVAQRRLSPVTVVSGGEREHRSQPSLVPSDLWRALDPVRHLHPGEGTRIGERLDEIRASQARSSLIIVLSDMHDPEAIPAVKRAVQKHDCVVIQLQDPAERGALRGGFIRALEAETGHSFVATGRTRWFNVDEGCSPELALCEVDHLLLRTDEPFLTKLRHFLSSRGVRRR